MSDDVLHPLHAQVLDAVEGLPDGPARTALLAVLDRHEPAHWEPERTFITCSECAILSWPPPADPASMWSDVVYPCATVIGIAEALGVTVPDWQERAGVALTNLDAFIERSNLGPAEAVLLHDRTGTEVAARLAERSKQISELNHD